MDISAESFSFEQRVEESSTVTAVHSSQGEADRGKVKSSNLYIRLYTLNIYMLCICIYYIRVCTNDLS